MNASIFANPKLFEFFNCPFKSKGDPSLLDDPSKILITGRMAKKYFADENPVGKTITIFAGQKSQKNLTVGAVLEDSPLNSSLYYDFITDEDNAIRSDEPLDRTDWERFVDITFLRLEKTPGKLPKVRRSTSAICSHSKRRQKKLGIKQLFIGIDDHCCTYR